MSPQLFVAASRFLARLGRFGEWALRRLGWVAYHAKSFTRPHAETCPGADVHTEPRPQGHIKRCRGCNAVVEIHFACWETEAGMMPPEVIKWIAEALLPSIPKPFGRLVEYEPTVTTGGSGSMVVKHFRFERDDEAPSAGGRQP